MACAEAYWSLLTRLGFADATDAARRIKDIDDICAIVTARIAAMLELYDSRNPQPQTPACGTWVCIYNDAGGMTPPCATAKEAFQQGLKEDPLGIVCVLCACGRHGCVTEATHDDATRGTLMGHLNNDVL